MYPIQTVPAETATAVGNVKSTQPHARPALIVTALDTPSSAPDSRRVRHRSPPGPAATRTPHPAPTRSLSPSPRCPPRSSELRHLLEVGRRRIGQRARRRRAERPGPTTRRHRDRDRRARRGRRVIVRHLQHRVVCPCRRIRERRLLHRRIAERPVAVQIPRIRDRVPRIRIRRPRTVEAHRQRRRPARRRADATAVGGLFVPPPPHGDVASRTWSSACRSWRARRTDSTDRPHSRRSSRCSAGRPPPSRIATGSDPTCARDVAQPDGAGLDRDGGREREVDPAPGPTCRDRHRVRDAEQRPGLPPESA